ncbi:MAG: YitT family protein [Bacteroidales bacterium]|nr:YitT family protein [Bacteroidales bacterium]
MKNKKMKEWFSQFMREAEKPLSKEWFIAYGKVIFGCFLFSLADFLCVVPYGMAPGGVYGLMSVFNNLWGWPMDIVILMDLPLFFLGLIMLGGNLGIKTLVSVIFTWLFTYLTENIFYVPQYGYIPLIHSGEFISCDTFSALSYQLQELYLPVRGIGNDTVLQYFKPDYLLNSIVGGLGYGVSIAIIFSAGATSGGMDVVSMILHRTTHIPLGTMVMIVDSAIALTSFAVGGDIRLPIFSVILVFVESKVIDLVIDNKVNKTMLIITDNIEGMKSLILEDLERSGTVFQGRGMYLNSEKKMIYTTVNRKEYNKIKYSAQRIDPKCFITVISNTETLGEGFTPLPEK